MESCELQIISQTENGKVFKCMTCNKIHVEFKNLNFTFSKNEYNFFRDYFIKLNPEKWEHINRNTYFHRKVMVPIGHKNFTASFHANEVYELKRLFKHSNKMEGHFRFINLDKIESQHSLN